MSIECNLLEVLDRRIKKLEAEKSVLSAEVKSANAAFEESDTACADLEDENSRLSAEVKRLAIEDEYNDQALDKYWKENKQLIAENKRLEALDKDWLRASEQWAAEIERQKHINATHLEEHQRLVAENKVLAESLLEAMEWNWCDDDWPEVMGNTFKQYADYALERVSTEQAPVSPKTAIEKDGINDRGSDEYANPVKKGQTQ